MFAYLIDDCFHQVIFETPGGGTLGRQQMASLPLQQEIFYPTQQPGYDDYEDYRTGPPRDGVYRGEIHLDSMSRGRPRSSYGEQETRFM